MAGHGTILRLALYMHKEGGTWTKFRTLMRCAFGKIMSLDLYKKRDCCTLSNAEDEILRKKIPSILNSVGTISRNKNWEIL